MNSPFLQNEKRMNIGDPSLNKISFSDGDSTPSKRHKKDPPRSGLDMLTAMKNPTAKEEEEDDKLKIHQETAGVMLNSKLKMRKMQ